MKLSPRSSQHKDVIRSSAIAFVIRALGAVAGFITTALIARELGAEESGYYFLAFTTVTILAAVSRVGMDNSIIRFVGRAPEQAMSIFYKSICLVVGASIFVAVCLYTLAGPLSEYFFQKPRMAPVLEGVSLAVIGVALFTLAANALQGLHKVLYSIFILNIAANTLLIAGILLFNISDAAILARLFAGSALIAAVSGYFLLLRMKPEQKGPGVSWEMLFKSCLPLWSVVIMGQMVQWSGQFIAGVYMAPEVVAQLAVAQRTAMLASFVLIAINLVVAPRFAAMHRNGDMEGLQSLAKTSVKLIGLLAMPVIAVMLVFPEFLMGLFGSGFTEGARLLQILAVGQFVNAITGSVGFLLMMCGYEKDMRNITLLSGSLALTLTWWLTAAYGAYGSATGTAIAVATQNLLAVYFVKRRLGFNILAIWRR